MKLLLVFLSATLLVHSTHGGCVKINIGRPNEPVFVPNNVCNSFGPVSSLLVSCTPTTKSLYSFNTADCTGVPAGSFSDIPLEAGESCAVTDQNCAVNIQAFADTACSKPESSQTFVPGECLAAGNTKFTCLPGPTGEYAFIESYDGAYCSGDVIQVTALKVGKRVLTTQSDICTGGMPPTPLEPTPGKGQFIFGQIFETQCDPTTAVTLFSASTPGTCDSSNEKAYCVNEGAGLVVVSYGQAGCTEPVLIQKMTDLSCVNGVVVSCFDESNTEPPPVSDLGENVVVGELFNDPFCAQKYGMATQKVDSCSSGTAYTCRDEETLVVTNYANAGDCSGAVNSRTEVAVGICQPFRNGFIKLVGKCPQMTVSEDDSDDDDGRPNKRSGGKRGRGNGPPGKYRKRKYKQSQANGGNKVRGTRYSPSRKSYRAWKGY